uniref:F-box family-8 n=1 Tax=Oryza nivara TaxID=4536 RepID=B9V0Q2_ORYNI|nr:F-box family-8 [Oryza sativa f. spontanea]
MPPKRKGLTSKKMAEAREEGGIDVLPDALLQHILSFLSADEAVKTSASYPAAGATPPLEIHAHPAYCQNGGQMGLGELRGFQQVCQHPTTLPWCPLFGNLKSLLLNEWCVANNFWALACILKKSPVLENFTLQISKDTKSMIETEENYNVLVKPVVTSKHLKVVKVHCTEVDEGVYKIVKFLTTLNIEVIMKRMD